MNSSLSSNGSSAHATLIEALDGNAWFRACPADLRAQLAALGGLLALPAGKRLFMRGDPDDGLYCLLEGSVRIGAPRFDGKEGPLRGIGPGNWVRGSPPFRGRRRTHDRDAERDALLFHVPRL